MKRLMAIILLAAFILPASLFADEHGTKEPGMFSEIMRLEGRGFSNAFLFPLEWGHLPENEIAFKPVGTFFVGLTHATTRIFSGLSDILFTPIIYPLSRYDESIPVGMGWGEYPWQKPQAY